MKNQGIPPDMQTCRLKERRYEVSYVRKKKNDNRKIQKPLVEGCGQGRGSKSKAASSLPRIWVEHNLTVRESYFEQ